jgi:hypothetical protein
LSEGEEKVEQSGDKNRKSRGKSMKHNRKTSAAGRKIDDKRQKPCDRRIQVKSNGEMHVGGLFICFRIFQDVQITDHL